MLSASPGRPSFVQTLFIVVPLTAAVLLLMNLNGIIHYRQGVWWYSGFPFVLWSSIGAILGLLLTLAIWRVRRTFRSTKSYLFAWWGIGAITGLLFGIGALNLYSWFFQITAGRDGSGGPALAMLFLIVIACSTTIGSIAGVLWGRKCARILKESLIDQTDC